MKNLLICCSFLLLTSMTAFAQDGGIQFAEGSWEEVLRQAAEQNKLIFVDVYTDWCGPCKMMSRNVFPASEVGAFFNEHFINYKMNAEKGEGPVFSRNYRVRAYPTLLFIDGNGKVVHQALGYHQNDPFLKLGESALRKADSGKSSK
ncbi:MAG: thioredoxin family protein [Saprospiraceae bacterium]|nr:thioredoxin family protein [Saprospiraceae bacterium]MCB0625817.1 thioredoxin family protein [Saprospiraceae bacterium]MCB0675126.1 thioredoxin family protein [Saprospiraceae bacterium]MCB0680847.1 thioredoxin family protein [Saprospiraceae bacterium]